MSKECVEIAVASTVLLDAHKQLTEYGSTADDRSSAVEACDLRV